MRMLVDAIVSLARVFADSLRFEELVLPELPEQEDSLCAGQDDDSISVVVCRPYKPLRLPSSYG